MGPKIVNPPDQPRGLVPLQRQRVLAHRLGQRRGVGRAGVGLDPDDVGIRRVQDEGHQSIRDDFESSCGEADRIVESAMRHGAWGARLTGAGWGGTVLVLAPAERTVGLAKAVAADFRREIGRAE